ncbi:hypothetical protein JCM11491_006003 [Sporobolomyces phaffii]
MSTNRKQLDRFLLLGDSITEWSFDNDGLGAQLAHLYHRRLDVVNRGLAGYNSRWALRAFADWLPRRPTDDAVAVTPTHPHTQLATLWLGANDSVLPGHKQHVPLAEFRDNLERAYLLLRDPDSPCHDAATEFVFVTPPPISVPDWLVERKRRGLTGQIDRDNANTRKYADAVVALGRDLAVPTVDAFAAIWTAATSEAETSGREFELVLGTYFTDGLHLSKKGYEQVVDRVKRVIGEAYPNKHWDSLPLLFPDWKTIPDQTQA